MATPKKKSTVRRAAADSKKAVATKKTATKKAAKAVKKSVAAPRKKAAGKKIAVKKAASKKAPVKKGLAKKSIGGKAIVKKAATKRAVAKSAVKKAATGKSIARKRSVKKGAAKAAAVTQKKVVKKATARKRSAGAKPGRGAGPFKGLPPLIRPSAQGETVIVEDITITDGKEIVFEMELIYTERVVSNDHVFDLHTQRDDKGQLIIDVYNVRKDGLVSIQGHRRIIFIGEAVEQPLTHHDYLQEYAELKQALDSVLLPD